MSEIIPKPVFEKRGSGQFVLSPQTTIFVNPGTAEIHSIGKYLASKLRISTGFPLEIRPGPGDPDGSSISLSLAEGDPLSGTEGYSLDVSPRKIGLSASHPAGLFHGIQTIRLLLPPIVESSSRQNTEWTIPAVTIHDRPRFAWRGAMLDVARHFFSPGDVKKFIDLLALYKLNICHLHLTDDQGWRIAIQSWPRLAEYGGSTQVGGGKGGYYTQEEYASIAAYAQSRHITLVPEIDVPGHTTAALASYPELTCDNTAPNLNTEPIGSASTLCTHKENTYRFLDDIIGEVAAITPGPYFHIGGDEAWGTEPEPYNTFIERIQAIVHKHGKQFIGWDETAQSRLAPNAIIQHWLINPEQRGLARKAVEQGAKIIMSPGEKAYFDMKYNPKTPFGQNWGGYVDVRHAYEWDPASEEDGVREKDILGVEATLWTETMASLEEVEFMTLPRLPGLAEIGWSPAAGREWEEYRLRLAAHGTRWKAAGINFYPSPLVNWVG